MDRKPTRADPQAAITMLFQTALIKASDRAAGSSPSPLHRQGHLPLAVRRWTPNPGRLAVVPDHLTVISNPAGAGHTVGCHETQRARRAPSEHPLFCTRLRSCWFIDRGRCNTGYIHPSVYFNLKQGCTSGCQPSEPGGFSEDWPGGPNLYHGP